MRGFDWRGALYCTIVIASSGPAAAQPNPPAAEPAGTAPSTKQPATIPASSEDNFLPSRRVRVLLAASVGEMAFNTRYATAALIDHTPLDFGLTAGAVFYDWVMVSGSIVHLAPFDLASSNSGGDSALTPDGDSMDTSVAVTSYSIAAGLHTPFWLFPSLETDRMAGALYAEYGTTRVTATRSVVDCVSCPTRALTIPDGSFWQVGAELLPVHWLGGHWGFGIAYQQYDAAAGIDHEIRVDVRGWLR